MHFNVYIDDQAGKQLNQLAKRFGRTRNALMREAVEEFLKKYIKPKWPKEILAFNGIKDFVPFEQYRDDLLPSDEDPFA